MTKAVATGALPLNTLSVSDLGNSDKAYWCGAGATFVRREMEEIEWDELAESFPDKDRERVQSLEPGTYVFDVETQQWTDARETPPVPSPS